jgi:phospholipid transport system substrate-binding protein
MRLPAFRLLFALLCVVAVAAPSGRPAEAQADPQGAANFVASLGDEVIRAVSAGMGPGQSVGILGDIFRRGFDVPTIGRFVLGRYWNVATPAQQQEYLRLFEEMIVRTYARRFDEYSGEVFQVMGTQPVSETDVQVRTQVVRPDGPPVMVDWRVRQLGGGNKIVDVAVEGVSMLVTQRNEFASVIQRGGGNVEALLAALRQQVASLGGA